MSTSLTFILFIPPTPVKAMGDFYQHKLRIKLSWWKRKSLFSVWSIFTFFCDTMLIVGSGLKILLQFDVML